MNVLRGMTEIFDEIFGYVLHLQDKSGYPIQYGIEAVGSASEERGAGSNSWQGYDIFVFRASRLALSLTQPSV